MLKHIRLRYKTRKAIEGKLYLCERCCKRPGVDVHHIMSSFRGKRKESEDGSDIILLCRKCHEDVHQHNNRTTRQSLLEVVKNHLEDIRSK